MLNFDVCVFVSASACVYVRMCMHVCVHACIHVCVHSEASIHSNTEMVIYRSILLYCHYSTRAVANRTWLPLDQNSQEPSFFHQVRFIVVMEAHFPHQPSTKVFPSQRLLLQLLAVVRLFQKCTTTVDHLSACQPLLSVAISFDKNTNWLHNNTLASDFVSVVNAFGCTKQLLVTSPLPTLLLNWIHSSAAFCILGLANILRTDLFHLDLSFYQLKSDGIYGH